jgi:hypothetical protein
MIPLLRVCVVAVAAVLAGCSSGVVSAGPQTYMISRSIAFAGTGATGKAKLYEEANEWCIARGLIMVPVTSDSTEPVAGKGMGSASLTFQALPPGHPGIHRSTIEKPDYTQRVQIR